MLTFFSSLTPPPSFSSASSHLSLPLHLISHPSLGLCLLATAAMLMQVDAVHIKNCCLLHLSKKPLDPRTLWSAPYRSGSVKWGPLKVETMERERERDIMKDWEKASRTADLIVFCWGKIVLFQHLDGCGKSHIKLHTVRVLSVFLEKNAALWVGFELVSVPGVSVLEKRHRQHFSKVRVWNTQWRGLVRLVWQKWMPHCAASFLLHQIWWSYRLKSGLSASKAVVYPLKFGLDGNKDVVLCWV